MSLRVRVKQTAYKSGKKTTAESTTLHSEMQECEKASETQYRHELYSFLDYYQTRHTLQDILPLRNIKTIESAAVPDEQFLVDNCRMRPA